MMAGDRQLDEKISTWLEAEAPGQLPNRVLSATFERTRESAQQGGWRRFRWSLPVNGFGTALTATAVVVIGVMAVGVYLNQPGIGGRPGSVASASPSPSATPDATQPAPTPTAAPTSTTTATPAPTAPPTPTSTPAPALITWNSQSGREDWPAPLRVEQPDSGVEAVERLSSQWVQYTDAEADTTPGDVSAVDLSTIHIGLGCVGGLPKLRCLELALSGQLADPLPLPEDAWYGYGIVLDVDSDGVPDYRYGVDNSDPGLGPVDGGGNRVRGRVWRADLRTGDVEVVAVAQATDDTLLGEFPTSDFPIAIFHLKNLGGRFYAWSSLIADGRVVATDYAPNVGWLELVNQ
jgi:hypothetical protein